MAQTTYATMFVGTVLALFGTNGGKKKERRTFSSTRPVSFAAGKKWPQKWPQYWPGKWQESNGFKSPCSRTSRRQRTYAAAATDAAAKVVTRKVAARQRQHRRRPPLARLPFGESVSSAALRALSRSFCSSSNSLISFRISRNERARSCVGQSGS